MIKGLEVETIKASKDCDIARLKINPVLDITTVYTRHGLDFCVRGERERKALARAFRFLADELENEKGV